MKKTTLLMRSLALLLCMLMLGSLFVACRKEEEPVETEAETTEVVTQTETVTETETIDDVEELPEVNYGGKEFKMLLRNSEDHVKDMYFETVQSAKEAVDLKIFSRNKAVENRFGVKIVCDKSSNGNLDTDQINPILGGEANYHLIGNHGRAMFKYATSSTLADWNQLNYLQTDKAYWCGGMREEFTINGKLFCFRGDMSIESLSSTVVMLFNKTVCTGNNMEYPYDLVEEGEWTFEAFKTMALQVGAGAATQIDPASGDPMGYMSTQFRGPITVLYSAGKSVVELNEEKTELVLTLADGDTDQLFKDYFGLIDQNNVYCKSGEGEGANTLKNFATGNILFFDTRLASIKDIIANGMDDYGILPWPKYNEDVEEYYSWCDPWGNTFGIPNTHGADELDFVAIVTEAMCAEGYREVMPVYYDTILLGQQATDSASVEMIEYIRAGRRYDVGTYMMDGSDYGSIGNCGTVLLGYEGHSFSTWWAGVQTQATTGLRNINALFSVATS